MALYIPPSTAHSPLQAIMPGPITSKCTSIATTKSTLRASNSNMLEMLQCIQAELFAHRSMMFDLQSRLSRIEQRQKRPSSVSSCSDVDLTEPRVIFRDQVKIPIDVERRKGSKVRQNFALSSHPPDTTIECFRAPQAVSVAVSSREKRRGHQASVGLEPTPAIPPKEKRTTVQVHEANLERAKPVPYMQATEVKVKELPPLPLPELPPVPVRKVPDGSTAVPKEENHFGAPMRGLISPNLLLKLKRTRASFHARFKNKKNNEGGRS